MPRLALECVQTRQFAQIAGFGINIPSCHLHSTKSRGIPWIISLLPAKNLAAKAGIDDIQLPVLASTTIVSLKHISHILPTVYKPPQAKGMASSSQGSIFFATGNKNKLKEASLRDQSFVLCCHNT